MARKITMNGQSRKSVAEVFEDFIVSQTAQGLYHTKSKEKRGAFSMTIVFLEQL